MTRKELINLLASYDLFLDRNNAVVSKTGNYRLKVKPKTCQLQLRHIDSYGKKEWLNLGSEYYSKLTLKNNELGNFHHYYGGVRFVKLDKF